MLLENEFRVAQLRLDYKLVYPAFLLRPCLKGRLRAISILFGSFQVLLEKLLGQARSNDGVSQSWPLLGNRDCHDSWSAVDVVAHAFFCFSVLKVIII